MSAITITILIIFGLCWGSFLNVILVRTVSQESIIYPPSKCPKCSHKLYWWHNIPIISFLILKGKCYFCNKTISIRYPIIEITGMLIVLLSFIKYISIFDALSVVLIVSMFLTTCLTDIEIKKISSVQVLLIVLSGLVFNRYDMFNSLTGALIGGGIIASLIVIGNTCLKKDILGKGDILLFMGLGSVVGFDKLLLFFIYTLIAQFIIILPRYITGLIRSEQSETLKYLIIFTITCLFLYVSRNIYNMALNIVIVGFLAILLYSAWKLVSNIFHNIKSAETTSYSPFAPAVAISCLIFLC